MTEEGAAEAICASEERYRAFVENSTEGIWRFDTDEPVPTSLPEDEQIDAFFRVGFLAEANDAFARMYGFTHGAELVGARLGDLMPREVPENEAYLRAFVRSGYRLADAESVERDRAGNLRHFSNTLTGIVEGGRLVRAWGTQRDITAQREAERRAERVAAELRLVTDAAPLLISYVGADLRYRLVNQGYADWFAAPKERIVGKAVSEVIGAAAFERSRPLVERALAGERVGYEALLPYGEGERPRFVHGEMVPDIGEGGEVRGYVAVISDISARREAEQERERLLAQLGAVLQTATDGIIVSDPVGNLLLWNPAALAMHGYESLDAARRHLSEFPETFALCPRGGEDGTLPLGEWPLSRLMRGETFTDLELLVRRLDTGREFWASYSGAPARGADGATLLLVLTVRDVSERARAESALRDSERRFRALADNIAQLAWMADATGSIFWYNRRWFEYTGTTLEEMKGWGWQKVHHPDHVGAVTDKFRAHVGAGEPWEDTFPLKGADGQFRWFLSRAFPTRDAAGRVALWCGTNTDVTEQREAAHRQRRFLKEMLAGFTEGRLRLCFSEAELPAPLPALSGPIPLSDDAALRPLRDALRRAAEGLGLPQERVQGFATAVHEAAVNAVKYGGGGTARVHGEADAGTLQVWVADDGPGIAEEMIHRAVEQGFTTQGFGLGMFYMQSCADRMYLLSEAGRGTTVVLEMDRQAPEPAWLTR